MIPAEIIFRWGSSQSAWFDHTCYSPTHAVRSAGIYARSARLFGLAYKTDALTLAERAAIVAFAQELEKKFLPSREERDVPLSATLSNARLPDGSTRRTSEVEMTKARSLDL